MSYPHEAQIRVWLENWVRWSPGTFGKSQWSDAVSSRVYDGAPVPIMSGEAADTQDALQRMDRTGRRLLVQHHLGNVPARILARRRKISMDTLERQLRDVHARFYQLRWDLKATARKVGVENAVSAGTSLQRRRTTVEHDVERIRLQRDQTKPTDEDPR